MMADRCWSSKAVVVAADKAKMGARYWHFNVNQLGQEDIEAQLEFIHSRKCDELPKHLAQAAHAAEDAQRRRTRVKCETSPRMNTLQGHAHTCERACMCCSQKPCSIAILDGLRDTCIPQWHYTHYRLPLLGHTAEDEGGEQYLAGSRKSQARTTSLPCTPLHLQSSSRN